MSFLFLNDPFDCRSSRLLDPHFGLNLHPEDLHTPTSPRDLNNWWRFPSGYLRPWRSSQKDSGSTVVAGREKFQASLDVQQFKPEEICVKVCGNVVTVEGKHEVKEDDHGCISRHFVRRYVVPKCYDLEKIESKLSSDGVLSIIVAKIEEEKGEEKNIPVVQTGEPLKTPEKKEIEEE